MLNDDDDDGDEGDRLKKEGMRLAADAQNGEDRAWRYFALARIYKVALILEYLDADDVRRSGVAEPLHANAWGSVWKEAIEKGWIIETLEQPRRRSSRSQAHRAKMTRYKSLIWDGF